MAKLIHVAKIYSPKGYETLYLRQKEPSNYAWYKDGADGTEEELKIAASNAEEAIRIAAKEWKEEDFQMIGCGFKFTLPERDEHGLNALFYQMAAALGTSNGVYFDEELGHHCIVRYIPQAARDLWKKLKSANRV